jgi:signal transduction histidine kinase
VRSIARQHGGRVFAHSEGEGKGATFTLELPRLSAEEAAAETRTQQAALST